MNSAKIGVSRSLLITVLNDEVVLSLEVCVVFRLLGQNKRRRMSGGPPENMIQLIPQGRFVGHNGISGSHESTFLPLPLIFSHDLRLGMGLSVSPPLILLSPAHSPLLCLFWPRSQKTTQTPKKKHNLIISNSDWQASKNPNF